MYAKIDRSVMPNIQNKLLINIFWLFNAASILSLMIASIKAGVLCSIIIITLLIPNKIQFVRDNLNNVFLVFLLINMISCLFYLFNGRPIIVLFSSISYNFIPMLLFFFGQRSVRQGVLNSTSKSILSANVFMMIVGLIPYLLFSDFYYKYIGQSLSIFTYGINDYRFGSYISSLNLGSVCAASIPLYFVNFGNIKFWQKIMFMPVIIVSLILCMQRGAWIVSAFAMLSCLMVFILQSKSNVGRKLSLFALLILGLLMVYVFRNDIFSQEQIAYLDRRMNSISIKKMLGERSTQWNAALLTFLDYPFGLGIGAAGHKAVPYGLSIVNDGNWIRVLVETGVIGIITFVVLNLMAVVRLIKGKKYYLTILILTFCLAAIGSNVFDLYYSSFIYWFFLGSACKLGKTKSINQQLYRRPTPNISNSAEQQFNSVY